MNEALGMGGGESHGGLQTDLYDFRQFHWAGAIARCDLPLHQCVAVARPSAQQPLHHAHRLHDF